MGSHRPCFLGGALGLGYMQPPCSGTHSVVVGRQKGKHEVVTGFAKCWAATSSDEVSMHGLCEEATAGLGGGLEIHFRGEPTSIQPDAGLDAGVKERRRLRHSWVRWPSRQT